MTAAAKNPSCDVRDLALADEGRRRTEWAERSMPVLRLLRERFAKERGLYLQWPLSAIQHSLTPE